MAKPRILPLLSILTLLPLVSLCQNTSAGSESALSPTASGKIIRRAQQAYYSLHAQGLQEFRCQVLLDWDTTYRNLKVDALGNEILPVLKVVRFQVVVGPTGASTLSHQSDIAPPSQEFAERTQQAIAGFEQVVAGFLQSWAQFAVGSMFSEPEGDYRLEEVPGKFRLTHRDSSGNILIVMNRDLVIEHLEVESPKVNGSIDPVFTVTKSGGLILSGYKAKVRNEQGQIQELTVKIENQDVQGFQLPGAVNAAISIPSGGLITMPISFTNCQTKRQ